LIVSQGHLVQRLKLRDQSGGIAVMGAVLALPLTVLAFVSVEYHRVSMIRAQLQDALDAGAIAVARSGEGTDAELQAVGEAVLKNTLAHNGMVKRFGPVNFKLVDGFVKADAVLYVQPIIAHMVMDKDLPVRVESEATLLGEKLEVALVLDNTYSMLDNNRLGITKAAATNFVNRLNTAAVASKAPEALKISLVPFSTTVNVGPANRYAAWIDQTGASKVHRENFDRAVSRFSLFAAMSTSWAGCVESRPAPYDVEETPPSPTKPDTLFVPYFAPDESDVDTSSYKNNYVPDETRNSADWFARLKNTDKYDQPPTTTAVIGAGYNHGPNYGCTLQPIVPLTTNVAAVRAGIQNMTATGDTNIPFGLMWGWHALSPNAPYALGSDYDSGARKIAVLMTDGQNAWYNNGSPAASIYSGAGYIINGRLGITGGGELARREALDARLAQICTNMKAKKIVIYTIRVEVTEGSADVLRNCATSPEHFFDVSQASQLDTVFDTIADKLLNPRILN
jgi:Flp pilus assembly protein TadG